MAPDLQSLLSVVKSGLTVWILCGGAFLCLFIESLWPRRMAPLTFLVGILTLTVVFIVAYLQWDVLIEVKALSLTHQIPLDKAIALVPAHKHWYLPDLAQGFIKIDLLTVFFLFLVTAIGILTLFNALGYLHLHQKITSDFCSLLLFCLAGMIFLFASDHLILNFIGLETMSLSLYVLVGSHKKNIKSNEAAVKYFIMGGVASAILLYGIALYYASFGTFYLSQIALRESAKNLVYLTQIALALVFVGLFFKLAIVPFHFWAPDVYEGAPAPVTGFMAAGVKVAVFGLLIRMLTGLAVLDLQSVQKLMTFLVVATLLVGNLLALVQDDMKRMLAYSSISHAGYLLLALLAGFKQGQFDASSTSPVLFYLMGYFAMTIGAFAILSLLTRQRSEATRMSDLRGLGYRHPFLALALTVFMLSMIGLPGTVGFAAKYGIVALAVENGHLGLAILAVVASVISVFYYLRPSVAMFFESEATDDVITEIPFTSGISITVCLLAVLFLGLKPDWYLPLSQIAATALVR
jgi:NADH-quinone oxidoreductase subunit N